MSFVFQKPAHEVVRKLRFTSLDKARVIWFKKKIKTPLIKTDNVIRPRAAPNKESSIKTRALIITCCR